MASAAHAVNFDERDKQYHLVGSYTLATAGSLYLKERHKLKPWKAALYAATGTLAIGALKELAIDEQADGRDMQANLIGTGVGIPIVFFDF